MVMFHEDLVEESRWIVMQRLPKLLRFPEGTSVPFLPGAKRGSEGEKSKFSQTKF